MRTRTFLLSSLSLALFAACSPTPTPTLSVTPESISATAGDTATALEAKVENSSATVNWKLTGDGTLSATQGVKVSYTPPATLNSSAAAFITASLSDGTLNKIITVSLKPKATLEIQAPSQPIVFNTAGVVFNAKLTGSTETILWSLEPATGAGSIDPKQGVTTQYTPPLSSTANQEVTLKAKAGALEQSVKFTVLLPTLTVSPADFTTLNAGLKQTFSVSTNNRDSVSPTVWTLEGVGKLNSADAKTVTGSSVEYSAPDPATVTLEQTVKLSAKLGSVTKTLEFKVKPTLKLLTITADKTELIAGEAPITIKLLRTLLAPGASVTFSVDPASKGGSISVIDANTYSYTPPAPADVAAPLTVTLSFTVDGLTKTVVLNIKPKPVLVVTPSSTTITAGSATPITLTAARTNLDAAKVIVYTVTSTTPPLATTGGITGNTVISVAPGNTATYTPPSSVTADTTVVITASTGTTPNDATTTVTLTVKPKPVVP